MSHSGIVIGIIAGTFIGTAATALAGADAGSSRSVRGVDRHTLVLLADRKPVRAFERFGRLMSVYGRPMASGAGVQDSADSFVETESDRLFGVPAEDIRPGVLYADGAHLDMSGIVDFADVLAVLAAWGDCT